MKLKVALIQQSCTGNRMENINKTISMIEKASQDGAELIALQELHTSLYFCQSENTINFDLAEPLPSETTKIFSQIAASKKIILITSLFERRAAGIYHNTAVVFDTDGSIAGKYRKMHIPDDPAFYEKFYFTPGDLGFEPIQTSRGKLGVLICWDQWFPEAARIMALKGAELLIYPTAIGWDIQDTKEEQERQLSAWLISQRAHAVANGLSVLSINRVGHEKDITGQTSGIKFWGNSFITGSQGELLKIASHDQEEILSQEIDLAQAEKVRRIWPFFRDRRIDAYSDILKLYNN